MGTMRIGMLSTISRQASPERNASLEAAPRASTSIWGYTSGNWSRVVAIGWSFPKCKQLHYTTLTGTIHQSQSSPAVSIFVCTHNLTYQIPTTSPGPLLLIVSKYRSTSQVTGEPITASHLTITSFRLRDSATEQPTLSSIQVPETTPLNDDADARD